MILQLIRALLILSLPLTAAAQSGPVPRSLPNSGRLHALVIFIDYPDDTIRPLHDFWRVGETPQWLASCIDRTVENPSGEKVNLTSYFRAMSLGALELTGDAYYVQAPKPLWRYAQSLRNDGTPEPEVQSRQAPWYTQRDVLRKLAPTIDMSRYDRWTIRDAGAGVYEIEEGPDGAIDLAIIAFRSRFGRGEGNGFGPMGWFAMDDTLTLETGGQLAISNTAAALDVAFYFPKVLDILLWNIGRLYMLRSQYGAGMWSMMSGAESVSNLMNGLERERVGWGHVIDIDRDTVVTIPDLASTGVSCRILYPTSGRVFYLENHQAQSQPGLTSALDGSTLTYDVVDRTEGGAPGLYVVRSNGGELLPMPADGLWTWRIHSWVTAVWSTTKQIPVYERVRLERDTGRNDRDWLPAFDNPVDGSDNYEPIFAWIDPSTGYISRGDRPLVWGDGNDRFTADGANVFSRWSSPSSTVRWWTSDTTRVEESCTMEVLDETADGIVVRVRFSDELAGPPSRPLGVRAHWSDDASAVPVVTWPASIEPDVIGGEGSTMTGRYEIWRSLCDRAGRRLDDWRLIGEVPADVLELTDTAFGAMMRSDLRYHLPPIPFYRIRVIDTLGIASNPSARFGLMRGVATLRSDDTTRRLWILPNPIHSSGTILYSVPEDAEVAVTIHDALGREMLSHRAFHVRGDYSIPFDPPSEGAYVVQMRYGEAVVQERIVVVR
jgi:hypothetical protein